MDMQKRDGIIVWMYNTKYLRQLRRYGYVHYISKRMKYAILYCNHEHAEQTAGQLAKLKFVRAVDFSPLQLVRTTYEQSKSKTETRDDAYS